MNDNNNNNDVEVKSMQVIYPIYINENKTIAEGRRLPKKKCVNNPTANELYDICRALKLPCELERTKKYPRDFYQVGRVRVLIKTKEGKPLNEKIPNKRCLLEFAGEMIPKLKSRTQKTSQSASSTSNKKKKGKKKRRK